VGGWGGGGACSLRPFCDPLRIPKHTFPLLCGKIVDLLANNFQEGSLAWAWLYIVLAIYLVLLANKSNK
jgi:hypothetical protein